MEIYPTEAWNFETIAARENFLDDHFPEREPTDTQGVYRITNGYRVVNLLSAILVREPEGSD